VVLAFSPPFCLAQQATSTEQLLPPPPPLVGEVENASGKLRLNLQSNDPVHSFRGTALISLGNSAQQVEAGKIALALGPREARLFPLQSSTAAGNLYTLTIYDQTGALIFYKTAPIKSVVDYGSGPTAAAAAPAAAPVAPAASEGEIKIQARLAGGEKENDPFLLAFEIAAPRPLLNATLSVNAKGFQQRQPVNVQGRSNVEFKLPDELDERKIGYSLTDPAGRMLAQGEVDLDQLMADDYISVGEVRLDRPTYAPGDSARVVLMLQGNSQHGYRLEVVAKEGRGTIFFRDTRRGISEGGKSVQEFTVPLPRETAGPLVLEFKVYDAETGMLFDSGEREISLTGGGGPIRPGS
jgi:hypothetical protein